MPPQVTSTTRVQVAFTVTDPDRSDGLSYSDALYYPLGQVPANTVVRAAAVERYREWRAVQDLPPPRLSRAQRLQAAQDARDAARAAADAADAVLAAEQASLEP